MSDYSSTVNVTYAEHEDHHEVEETEEDFYTRLITKGPFVRGDDRDLVPLEEISWFDKTLIEHAQNFYKKHLTFILLSTTSALMFGFAVKPNTAVLLRTGKLHDPELSYQRYLSTMQRIGKFFMHSIDPEKSYKAFATVRKMHALASKKGMPKPEDNVKSLDLSEPWKIELVAAMRKDLEHLDTSEAPHKILTWDPPVPVSQFDMATTQFGFVGTMWLYPKIFGIEDRAEEMKGMIHYWALFGRLLGIRDEFNILIKPDAELFDKLFRNIVVESLKTMDESVVTIQAAFMEAFSKRVPFITYKAMLYIGLMELEGYQGENLWKLMSWWDVTSLKIIQSWLWLIRNCKPYRICMNIVTALWVQLQFWLYLSN